ncbi:MAG: hypothetical protein KAY37_16800 [Phycisphaerae bacterium]|nr:hypothetical protein [Phycisphaerae bacterium]
MLLRRNIGWVLLGMVGLVAPPGFGQGETTLTPDGLPPDLQPVECIPMDEELSDGALLFGDKYINVFMVQGDDIPGEYRFAVPGDDGVEQWWTIAVSVWPQPITSDFVIRRSVQLDFTTVDTTVVSYESLAQQMQIGGVGGDTKPSPAIALPLVEGVYELWGSDGSVVLMVRPGYFKGCWEIGPFKFRYTYIECPNGARRLIIAIYWWDGERWRRIWQGDTGWVQPAQPTAPPLVAGNFWSGIEAVIKEIDASIMELQPAAREMLDEMWPQVWEAIRDLPLEELPDQAEQSETLLKT